MASVSNGYEFPYELRMLPVTQLLIDAVDEPVGRVLKGDGMMRYQRVQKTVRRRIVEDGIDPYLLQPLVVSKRTASQYAIIDGGGRYGAVNYLIAEGRLPRDFKVPCLVFQSNDSKIEPRLFIDLNQEKLGLSQVDIFQGKVAMGDPDFVLMSQIIAQTTGMTVKKGGIESVDAIKTIFARENGQHDLRRVLSLLVAADWLSQDKGKNGAIIGGLGSLVALHHPAHNDEFILAGLRARTPEAVLTEARKWSPGGGGSRKLGIGVAIVLANLVREKNDVRKGATNKGYVNPMTFMTDAMRKEFGLGD